MSSPSQGKLARLQEVQASDDKIYFGFWMYLMTDCVLFASLFATYAVMHTSTFGGPSGKDLFDLNFVLLETIILLTSSFTCGLAVLSARQNRVRAVLGWLAATFVLGLSFLCLELNEFSRFVAEGHSWTHNGFLSAFFTLVGTHGLHIFVGLLWLTVLAAGIWLKGLDHRIVRRLTLFSMFWHFLDLIWIFIFTIVYLFGVIGL